MEEGKEKEKQPEKEVGGVEIVFGRSLGINFFDFTMITQHNNTKKPWKWSEEVVREVWCKNVGNC